MSRIKSLFKIFMRRRGWVPLAEANTAARLMHLAHRQSRDLLHNIDQLEKRLLLVEGEGAREYIVELERRMNAIQKAVKKYAKREVAVERTKRRL